MATKPLLRLGGMVGELLAEQQRRQEQQQAGATGAAAAHGGIGGPLGGTADYSVQWLDLRVQPGGAAAAAAQQQQQQR